MDVVINIALSYTITGQLSRLFLWGRRSASVPQAVYQDVASAADGVSQELRYDLPVPAGDYQVTLHFVEPYSNSVGSRVFQIEFQGQVVENAFDIVASAGAQLKAVSRTYNVSVTGQQGIVLELINHTSQAAVLAGLEIRQPNASAASPTATVDLSVDSGAHWSTLATRQAVDPDGYGQFSWTPLSATASNTGLVRVTAEQGTKASDVSLGSFIVAAAGHDFYVNDSAVQAGDWTTAPGDNTFSGKDPAHPVASLFTLLNAYHFASGDVVHVDDGSYPVLNNIELGPDKTGLTIQGFQAASSGTLMATFSRGNTNTGRVVLDFAGADRVTVQTLNLSGAWAGIFSDDGMQSTDLRFIGNHIYGNQVYGISIGQTDDRAVIQGNTINGIKGGASDDDQITGISVSSVDARIDSNRVYDHHGIGVYVTGSNEQITNNEVYGNATGIDSNYQGDGQDVLVSGNRVHDNLSIGITALNHAVIQNNDISSQLLNKAVGLDVDQHAVARNNRVWNNYVGITARDAALVDANFIFANRTSGVSVNGNATVSDDRIYSNSTGIQTTVDFSGSVVSCLIYSNTDYGVIVASEAALPARLINNTIVQPVGSAVQIPSGDVWVILRNNIFVADSGSAFQMASADFSKFFSDYNLFSLGAAAQLALLDTTPVNFAAWTSVQNQDAHSLTGDPKFIDPNGADNVLGYSAAGLGYDGGPDDNFELGKGSPAIDRADEWSAPGRDATGRGRSDDPATPNLGSPDYVATDLGSSVFSAAGTAQRWQSGSGSYELQLPFSFGFYGQTYDTVYVSPRGFVGFAPLLDDPTSSTSELAQNARIAPLWDSLRTDVGAAADIYVTSSSTQETIRWEAVNTRDNSPVRFAVTLFDDGRIRFDYGAGNTNLSPIIGISAGNGVNFLLSPLSGQTSLNSAHSFEIKTQGGASFADIGAFEFRGSSSDNTLPVVTGAVSTAIFTGATPVAALHQITLQFNKGISPIDANASSSFDLRSPGPDGLYDTGDDVVYPVAATYVSPSRSLTLTVKSGDLAPGSYRLKVVGIHDDSGNVLDGNGDGISGDAFVRVFTVTADAPRLVSFVVNEGSSARSSVKKLVFVFSTNVNASLGLDDFSIVNAQEVAVPASAMALEYDATANSATLTFPGLPSQLLPDGVFAVTVKAAGVTNSPKTSALLELNG
ncbi:MAG: right-handed parallel beta-helix repeat-containing protein [Limisphaerales bacterium]